MERPRVVIVGGGYAGVKALERLAQSGLCEVVLVDQHPYHYLQTEAYELIANECSMSDVTIDLVALCLSYGEHVTFVKDTVREIDVERRRVIGETSGHQYDYLLLCAGSRTAFTSATEGLRQYSQGVKTLRSALSFKQQFEQRLFERMESEGGWCSEPFNIVIGGGGLSGVEIAAEMAYYIRSFYRENTLTCDNMHVYLIIPHENVLDGMEPYLVNAAMVRLRSLGVNIVNHSRITSVEDHALILNGSDRICFDFMIFTGGIIASTLTSKLELPKNKKGQLTVDPFLQVCDRVFAAGDIADLRDRSGSPIPPTAQGSEQSGDQAAQNILFAIKGRPMTPADLRLKGMMIALGGQYAAISLLGWIRSTGWAGYWIKRLLMRGYRYLIHRQCLRGIGKLPKRQRGCRMGF